MTQDCIGSSFDDFLKEEDIFDECEAAAIKTVIEFQDKQNKKDDNSS